MSNLIKSSFVAFSEQKKTIEVIDSNHKKIINKDQSNIDELDSKEDYDLEDSGETVDSYEDEGFGSSGQEAERILMDARTQAEQILRDAEEEVIQAMNEAREQGHEVGYQDGKRQALSEVQDLKSQLESELSIVREQREYLCNDIEIKMAGIIEKLVQNMVGIQAFSESTILFLIRMGLDEVDLHGDITIRVSAEDFHQVLQHRESLMENLSDKMELEVLKDSNLRRNDCIIETELGSIDCSLNEKMDGLIKHLKLIQKSFGLQEET